MITCRKTETHIEFRFNNVSLESFDPIDDMMFVPLLAVDNITPDYWSPEYIVFDENKNETIYKGLSTNSYIGIRYDLSVWPEKYRLKIAKNALSTMKRNFSENTIVIIK